MGRVVRINDWVTKLTAASNVPIDGFVKLLFE
jgi:hypothetical protein